MGLSPFREFWDMQSQMNRMFNEMLGSNVGRSPARQLEGLAEWVPVEQEEERSGYYIRERRYGSFSRSFTLPQGTDESKVRARFENGVLEVTVEGAGVVEEPKRIQIEGPGS